MERSAGILCHISSLPNKYGIGSLGKEAYEFARFLKKSHVEYWQILPLVQTGYGDSPYQSVSCISGNPYFIDLEDLVDRGLLTVDELESCKRSIKNVDYGDLYNNRFTVLRKAYSRFDIEDNEFKAFIQEGSFEDYAMFMSLKSVYPQSFDAFPHVYKYREQVPMFEFKMNYYKSEYCFWMFVQYIFSLQWAKLKAFVNSLGIKIIGDLPLYVAYDSADVWSNPHLFMLDDQLKPTEVAGCPPDYFSRTGQLWGNPLYNWEVMALDDYKWWVDRVRVASNFYDVIRIDHFRGLSAYYSIPFGNPTAEYGEWKQGPAMELINAIKAGVTGVEIIAEDLGVLDDAAIALREDSGFAGMNITQFAFDGNLDNAYLPNNVHVNSVTYTGTHDNDTMVGFLQKMDSETYKAVRTQLRNTLEEQLGVRYPLTGVEETALGFIVCTMANISNLAIIPIQDLLFLDNAARMNVPAIGEGNWQFRLKNMPTRYDAALMRSLVRAYERECDNKAKFGITCMDSQVYSLEDIK